MQTLADRLNAIKPSPTIAMTTLAGEMQRAGRDIISLSAGEPDFDTPEHIRRAAFDAIENGQTRYTPPGGTPELKDAISRHFAEQTGHEASAREIIVSAGGKHVLFNALMASVNPGDEVVIPAPYWVSYPDMTRLCGGAPVIIETKPEEGYLLTPEALERAITPKTRWLLLNSPGNPSGAAYTAAQLDALAEVLRRHPQVMILCDDIYREITFDGFTFATMITAAPDLKDRILTMDGVSKAYAMTGWRIGYGIGPEWLIQGMHVIQSQSTSCASSVSQAAALAALEGPQDFLEAWRGSFRERRDFVVGRLNACKGVTCPFPQGAFYAFPSIRDCIGTMSAGGREIRSDEDFCMALLEEEGVATVFGSAFGLSPNFRFSYATSMDKLEEACKRIERFCEKLRR
ncbi:pyridoxal phosphate-dependent aminotransferase [Paracoccaceae bacterium GXU_MW_L88]